MKVHFYLPAQYLPTPELAEQWEKGTLRLLPAGGRIACSQGWIYQTWVNLQNLADIELTSTLPESGVIVAMSNSLHTDFRANDNQFVVAIAADYEPHPGAHLQILQNRTIQLPHSLYLSHWPQPGLIPRDPQRGDRFETLAFFGAPENLADGLTEAKWPGLELRIPSPEEWHDFSEVDCVLGIRSFTTDTYPRKPATKLYNAWIAGTTFIGGRDSALRGEQKSELDYLEAHTLEEVTQQLKRLQADPALRTAMMTNSLLRAEEFNQAACRKQWLDFLNVQLPERVERWNHSNRLKRSFFWNTQRLNLAVRRKLGW